MELTLPRESPVMNDDGLRPAVIIRKWDAALDVVGFELGLEGLTRPPGIAPGAHLELHAGGFVRQYSLCNPPGIRDRYVIAIRRDAAGRGGSRWLCDSLEPGDRIMVREPRNRFPLQEDAPSYVLIAGGIGITPMIAMADRLHDAGKRFTLHYAARTPDHMAFADRLAAAPYAAAVALHFDGGPSPSPLRLTEAIPPHDGASRLYVCGPEGMIDAAVAAATAAGWPQDRVHFERFGQAAARATDATFTVVVASTGQEAEVTPDTTIACALAAIGVAIPTSCEQGICGMCLTPVLDGVPDHRDSYLTDDERQGNGLITPCCSRARTARLTLDI